ncbi:MAG: MgtC/SapB family protein [Ruminococcaceae bacterium]|nr:MgtC/SapB family protein [Oscillospiraceae bacterium]MBQ8324352.1 MgtC/SapB family protein [Clostridia bacterium]
MIVDPIADLLGTWSTEINLCSVLLRVAVSVILGMLIGCERSSKRHAAGLRTFMLVSLASTVAILMDLYLGRDLFLLSAASVIGIAIITVNSVLFTSRNQIKGLTTSVGLWACGILGLAIGAGLYTVTIVAFLALLCSLSLFPHVEGYLKNRSNHFEVHLELKNVAYLQNFVATIRELGLTIDEIEANTAYLNSGLAVYSLALTITGKELRKYKTHIEIIRALGSLEYVNHIEEI